MNRLRILLITIALIMGSSALASAEKHHQNGWGYPNSYGDHDRDDRNVYRNRRWRDRDDRRRRDRDDYRWGWGRDRDNDRR